MSLTSRIRLRKITTRCPGEVLPEAASAKLLSGGVELRPVADAPGASEAGAELTALFKASVLSFALPLTSSCRRHTTGCAATSTVRLCSDETSFGSGLKSWQMVAVEDSSRKLDNNCLSANRLVKR